MRNGIFTKMKPKIKYFLKIGCIYFATLVILHSDFFGINVLIFQKKLLYMAIKKLYKKLKKNVTIFHFTLI